MKPLMMEEMDGVLGVVRILFSLSSSIRTTPKNSLLSSWKLFHRCEKEKGIHGETTSGRCGKVNSCRLTVNRRTPFSFIVDG
jgi:hypothetical protein